MVEEEGLSAGQLVFFFFFSSRQPLQCNALIRSERPKYRFKLNILEFEDNFSKFHRLRHRSLAGHILVLIHSVPVNRECGATKTVDRSRKVYELALLLHAYTGVTSAAFQLVYFLSLFNCIVSGRLGLGCWIIVLREVNSEPKLTIFLRSVN